MRFEKRVTISALAWTRDQQGLMDWTAGFAPHFEAIGAKKLRHVLERFAFDRLRLRVGVAHGIHRGGRPDLT